MRVEVERAGAAPGPAAVEAIVAKNAADLAAIIIEPVMGVAGTIVPEPGFLALLRDLASRHGIVLIFDEVISLRLAYGGAEELFGVAPDLRTMGKIIGGGFPIGAVGGRTDIMAVFNPQHARPVTLSGTFHANPIALAAGRSTLRLLTARAIEDLNRKSADTVGRMRRMLEAASVPVLINSIGSLFTLHATRDPVVDYRSAARADKEFARCLHLAMLLEGVLMSPRGMGCFSIPMNQSDHDGFVVAFERSLGRMGVIPAREMAKT